MKTIIFVRHGKSSWEYSVDDKDRPLKQRGIDDAHKVALELKRTNNVIDACFSSPANRALHTASIFLRMLSVNFEQFMVQDALYDFSGESVLHFLKSLNDELSSIMIFGHNHALTALVNMLGDTYLENLPTSGVAIVEFNFNHWSDLKDGKTKQIIIPKELR